jgi:transposase
MKRSWFIGIDISKKTLDISIYDIETRRSRKHFKVENNLKGFKRILRELSQERVALKTAFVCMEYCGVYGIEIGFFLEGKIEYCFCNALHIKRSLGLTRGKSDKLDALKIARFCYLFRDELEATLMPSGILLKLKALMSERVRLTKSIVIEKQVLKELSSILSEQSINRSEDRLLNLQADLKCIDKEIKTLVHEDKQISKSYDLLTSITGISLVNGVMIILCTNNFQGINNARSFACYCGVAPFEYSSGTSVRGATKVSQYANKKMNSDLTNAARSAVIHDAEIRIYYKRKRKEGKSHGTVMNAVKFKLITRAFAIVKRGTPFVKLRQAG